MNRGIINSVFEEITSAGIDIARMSQDDQNLLRQFCNKKRLIVWINNHSNLEPVFINDYGLHYYGYERNDLTKEGFDLYSQLIHPEHFSDVHRTINHFSTRPKEVFFMPYYVKHHSGEWRWTFSEAKSLNFSAEGAPIYVLSIVYDLEELLSRVDLSPKISFTKEMVERFRSLTAREKEILILISTEKTSHEIAEQLHIETSTVDTHRKHLIRKLGVKSSIGLVRYALLFN